MAGWGYIDSREFREFQEKLQQFTEVDKDTFCREAAKELAARLLRGAIKNTPVGQYSDGRVGGTLKKAWSCDYNVVYRGDEYRITVYNPTEYASYVEFGHRKRGGKGWVNGRFMLTRAEEKLDPQVPKILEARLQKELERIFK